MEKKKNRKKKNNMKIVFIDIFWIIKNYSECLSSDILKVIRFQFDRLFLSMQIEEKRKYKEKIDTIRQLT